MFGSTAEQIKGMIIYPCCANKKAMVKCGASGKATHPCPQCGKFIEFDYDRMSARVTKAERGAAQKFRTIANCMSEVSLSR